MKKGLYFLITCSLLLVGCQKKEPSSSFEQTNINEKIYDFSVVNQIMEKLSLKTNFMIQTKGNSLAKQGLIQYQQDIKTTTYAINEQFFMNTESSSLFIKFKHQAFVDYQFVYLLDSNENNQLQKITIANYKEKYGIIPSYQTIFSFTINEETIKECYFNQNQDILTYFFILDNETATENIKIQMKQFGGLNDLPTFSKIILNLNVNHNFELLSYQSYAQYQIKKDLLGTFNCTQQLKSQIFYENYPEADLSFLTNIKSC